MEEVIEIQVRNDLADMQTASAALDDIGQRFSIPAKALMQLQVALDEMLSNVIRYAWPDQAEHQALVRFVIARDQVSIEIIDDGQPFDPRQAQAPQGGKPAPGGRGIKMAKRLVDIDYHCTEGLNHLILRKKTTVTLNSDNDR